MSPTPRRQPMVICPHCGAGNDPARGSRYCVSCTLPLDGAYEQAITGAARILTDVRAHLATLTAEQAADAAYIPGGPSREQLAARVRELRAQTRRASRAA